MAVRLIKPEIVFAFLPFAGNFSLALPTPAVGVAGTDFMTLAGELAAPS